MLELSTFILLADISPLKLAVVIVSNSGADVAYPAMSPTVFGFKFSASASFLKVVTRIYFAITTISAEYTINFKNSIINPFKF